MQYLLVYGEFPHAEKSLQYPHTVSDLFILILNNANKKILFPGYTENWNPLNHKVSCLCAEKSLPICAIYFPKY